MTTAQFYTVKEYAEVMKVHENTVYAWIENKIISAIKIGGLWRIPVDAIPKVK
jgi:excisionase family DNA binding protein